MNQVVLDKESLYTIAQANYTLVQEHTFTVDGIYEMAPYFSEAPVFLFRVIEIADRKLTGEIINTKGGNFYTQIDPTYFKAVDKEVLDFSLAKMKGSYVL